MQKIKVMTILGTRPEIIRLSRVMAVLDQHTDHTVVHTGQNYDHELNEIFFEELGLRKPDICLDVDTSSLGSVLGNILIQIEKVLIESSPDAVLVLGDTNSSIATIMAKRLKIPIYHMEAGNRSYDPNVPEEVNRKMVDHLADFNLVYTEHARRHLLSEGLPHRRIYLTGSPMKEILDFYKKEIDGSDVLKRESLQAGDYFLASIHREENVDNEKNLRTLLDSFEAMCQRYSLPILVSTHPRTRKKIKDLKGYSAHSNITFAKPFGFFDYNKLQQEAFCVLSDSGTITEEASLLGFPAVTVRQSMERPEGLDTASIMLTGLCSNIILQGIDIVTSNHKSGQHPPVPTEYLSDNVSERVLKLIVGTAHISNEWSGVRKHDE